MPLIDTSNPSANWHDVLAIWSRLANWTHYKPTQRELDQSVRQFVVALWSEKDWLITQYPEKRVEIERFMSLSEPLSIIADLANTTKHRSLTRASRSSMAQTKLYGQVSVGSGVSRQLHYLRLAGGRHTEIMTILRLGLDSMESYRLRLRSEAASKPEFNDLVESQGKRNG